MSWTIGNKEVQSLHIGNKEVQSIVRVSDSKVLYEKPASYSISLVADKYIASTGETVTFTATVTDGGGSPVVGETVTFKEGANVLGTGVTNASGICSVSYSWNYTNTLNIKAFYDTIESNIITIEIKQPLTLTFTGDTFTPYDSSMNKGLVGSDMIINWGDGTTESLTSNTKLPSHTYSSSTTHTIQITGEINSIGGSCFREITGLSDITIPSSVTTMDSSCFSGCSALTNINIPSGVTSIPDYSFRNCVSLTNIIIPSNVTSIGNYSFYGCSALTNIIIPVGVISIGSDCFQKCTSLTTITIPSTVTTFKNYCFDSCSALTTITIPSSVTSFGKYCFSVCQITDYQLYWDNPPVTWSNNLMPNRARTYYTIPHGTTANYVAKSFPSAKLIERSA